jgi:hypothetical protein
MGDIGWQVRGRFILACEIGHRLPVELGQACQLDCLDSALSVLNIGQSSPRNLQISGDLLLLETEILASFSQSITQVAAIYFIASLSIWKFRHG